MDAEWEDLPTPPRTTLIEARKALGSTYEHLHDDQVIELVLILTKLARYSLNI